MRRFFINHCALYRRLICKMFGAKHRPALHFPCGILGDWRIFYVAYDKDGNVQKGFKSLWEALRNKEDLYLSVLYD